MSDKVAVELYNIALKYYYGSGGFPLNYTKALELLQKSAENGESKAMNFIGVIYENGKGVPHDAVLAAEWYYKALERDTENAVAAYNLGRMYYNGTGVAKNMIKAYKYCKMSVDLKGGNERSVYAQACLITGCVLLEHYKNYAEAYPYFKYAAKYGNIAEAWHNLGYLTEKGYVPSNIPASQKDSFAKDFYERAAELGYTPSMLAVGRLYSSHNMAKEGKFWVERAAALGNEQAKKMMSGLSRFWYD